MNFKLKTTALILLGLFINCQNKEQKKSKPNVILVIVDDMGFSDLGAYGSEINTPNIDRLATEGIRFSNAYNTSKCFPSRACILTGLYSQQTGYNKDFRRPMRNAITLGELFKSAGYTTLWSGKHHSTENPIDRGFDHYSGLLDGASNHFNPGKKRDGEAPPAHKVGKIRNWAIEGEILTPYTPESKDFYTTDTFTDYALGWINQIEAEQPFFLYLSYTAPHDPLMAWPEDIKKYEEKYNIGYETIRKARFQKQLHLGILPKNSELSIAYHKKWSTLSEQERKEESHTMAVYAAMIDRIDQNIGRLTEKLKEQGTLENTLILFTSDNGASGEVVNVPDGTGEIGAATNWKSLGKNWANVSNTPYKFFKNWSHEGGIKTPLIAYWPKKIKASNRVVHTPVHFIDFMSTFSELLGIDYPTNYMGEEIIPSPGISFLKALTNQKIDANSRAIFWEWNKGKAIRKGDWKLVAYNNVWELYDLKNDPIEQNNVIAKNTAVEKELKMLHQQWMAETKE